MNNIYNEYNMMVNGKIYGEVYSIARDLFDKYKNTNPRELSHMTIHLVTMLESEFVLHNSMKIKNTEKHELDVLNKIFEDRDIGSII